MPLIFEWDQNKSLDVEKRQDPKRRHMKKKIRNSKNTDMRNEYDFSGGVRGKHYKAYRKGHTIYINKDNGSHLCNILPKKMDLLCLILMLKLILLIQNQSIKLYVLSLLNINESGCGTKGWSRRLGPVALKGLCHL